MRRAASVNHFSRVGSSFSGSEPTRYWYAPRLASLMVHATPIRSPRCAAVRSQYRANSSAVFLSSHPPSPATHRGRGEVMKGYDRRDLVLVTACEHAAVMVERGARELAGFGLDARPFDREAVGVEAESREHRDVVGVAMVLIAGVARRLDERRPRRMLENPVVAIEVVALDLVGGGRCAPQKIGGKGETLSGHRTYTSRRNPSDATAKSRSRQPAYLKIACEM